MKYLKLILALVACSFFDHLGLAADGASLPQTTTHGFDRENFCAEGAKKQIDHLNNLTKDDAAKIEDLKKKINELDAKKKIITDLQSIRSEYLAAFEAINSDSAIAKKTFEVKKGAINQFKNLLSKTLTLNALSLITNRVVPLKEIPQNLKELCADKENSDLLFCKRYGEQWHPRGLGNDSEIDGLNKTIANFAHSMNQIPDSQLVIVDAKNIIDSIPEGIKPDGILEIFQRKSPALLEILTKGKSQDEVMNCLDGNGTSCEKLLNDSEKRAMIKDIIGKEITNVRNDFSDKYLPVKEQINARNAKDLTALLHTFDYPLEGRDESNKKLLNDKVAQVKAYSEILFNKHYPAGSIKNGFKIIGLEDNEYKSLTELCEINAKTIKEELREQINKCQKEVGVLLQKAEAAKNSMSKETETLRKELASLLHDNSRLNKIEKVKQFVIQRFMRGCSPGKDNQLVSNIMQITCEELSHEPIGQDDKMESLAGTFGEVVGQLQQGNKASHQKGELGLFSKDELKTYMNFCQNTSLEKDDVLTDSCQKINSYYSEIANQKESKEWDDFNRKYWVQHSSTNKKGYDVYEKKSNARILGEGLSQSINNIYPIWFGNYQLNSQIDMMTNQALYQKQMLYMNSTNSPWMNVPYFQGSYFPNPSFNFMGGAGFNFSN